MFTRAARGLADRIELCVPLRIVGIPDEEPVSDTQYDVLRHCGNSTQSLAEVKLMLWEAGA
jgi:hypothetical protein